MPKKKKKDLQGFVIGTVIVLLLGLGIFGIFNQFSDEVYDINYEGQPFMGSANAPVKVIEFGDFKCPSCKNFHTHILPRLKAEFIDTGKVQFFFSNYVVLGEDSLTAALAGESIYKQDPDSFWDYYNLMFENQQDESTVWATPPFIEQLVEKNIPKIDAKKLTHDLEQKTHESEVQKDIQSLESLGARSVPTIYVNGKEVNGMNYQELKKAIEKELK